jgi:hypothetical protein
MTAMDELGIAKEQLRTALLRAVKGALAADRADELIDRHQHALKQAYRERLLQPARGDQFEQWLKTQRDAAADYPDAWQMMDGLLDLYRLHADTGTPLDQHACENGTVDDCHGCYEAAKARRK